MNDNWLARFWGVIIRPQTYLNLAYLFLAFPLGVVYFVFFVTGLSLGFPLIIVWIGLIILAVVFAAAWGLALFERQMAIWLLRVDVGPMGDDPNPADDLWQRFKKYIGNPVTWKSLFFLLLKFPLGLISFILGVTLLTTSLALVFSPLILLFFPNAQINFFEWAVHPAVGALIGFILGILLVPVSLHILNGLAWLYGRIAYYLLGRVETHRAIVPAAPLAASITPAAAAPVSAPQPTPEAEVAAEPILLEPPAAPLEAEPPVEEEPLLDLFPPDPDEPASPEPPAQP